MFWFVLAAFASPVVVPGPSLRVMEADFPEARLRSPTGDLLVSRIGPDDGVWALRGPSGAMPLLLPRMPNEVVHDGADFDGDGHDDLVTSTLGEVLVRDSSTFAIIAEVSVPPGAQYLAAGDLDGDGQVEILVEAGSPVEVRALDLSGQPLWSIDSPYRQPVMLAQLDGDPQPEIIVGTAYYDGGTGVFEDRLAPAASRVSAPAVGDVDGDGLHDVLFYTSPDWVLWSQGSVLWTVPGSRGSEGAVLFDIDGDGLDEAYTSGGDLREAFERDGETGAVRRSLWTAATAAPQYGWTPAPGVREVIVGNTAFDSAGAVPVTLSNQLGRLEVVDLDRDGEEEVLVLGRSAALFRADGTLLPSMLDQGFGTSAGIYDVDGDGLGELVTTYDGLTIQRWSPVGGYRIGASYPISLPRRSNPTFVDSDGDGFPELYYESVASLRRLNLRSGADVSIATGGSVQWEFADLDGDGREEIIEYGSRLVRVLDLDGVEMDRVQGVKASDIAEHGGRSDLMLVGTQRAALYAFRMGRLVRVADTPVPAAADYWFEHGRIWYADADGLHGVDPVTGEAWLFATPVMPTTPPLVHDGALWLVSDALVERWDLP